MLHINILRNCVKWFSTPDQKEVDITMIQTYINQEQRSEILATLELLK